MHWFFNSDIQADTFETSADESRHIAKVLRMVPGDEARFIDGRGNLYSCSLIDSHPKKCSFRVIRKEYFPGQDNYHLHMAVAPTKNISRFEWFLEKAIEIGIHEITPLICDHSERTRLKTDRLEKIAVSAIKQSQQVWLPTINEPSGFREFIGAVPENASKYIAWVSDDHDTLLRDHYRKGKDVTILIGPEGDFSTEEIHRAINSGYQPISLGKNRLRTETAALVACHTIVLLNQ